MCCQFGGLFYRGARIEEDTQDNEHSIEDNGIAIVDKYIDLSRVAVWDIVDGLY